MTDDNSPRPQGPPPAGPSGQGVPSASEGPGGPPPAARADPAAHAAPVVPSGGEGPGGPAPGAGAEPAAPPPAAKQAERPPAPVPTRPTLLVRYGRMALLGRFTHSLSEWRCGQTVIVKSDRGMEIGSIVGLCCGAAAESASAKPEGQGAEAALPELKGEILRPATHADEIELKHLHDSESRAMEFCRRRVAARQLPMKLVSVEHLFGGDRIIFYFTAESRVDFRALVRDLAQEFQTRIEMRQIGVRDGARLLGDFERCGRPLCCRAWMRDLAPVSMKMAKVQKATLDPTKISGYCGRLMCCLRFEHATYQELSRNLPRRNTYVRVAEGVGKVIDADVVTQIAALEIVGGARVNVPVESILERNLGPEAVSEALRQGERGGRRWSRPGAEPASEAPAAPPERRATGPGRGDESPGPRAEPSAPAAPAGGAGAPRQGPSAGPGGPAPDQPAGPPGTPARSRWKRGRRRRHRPRGPEGAP